MASKVKSNSVVTYRVGEDGNMVFTVLGAGPIVDDKATSADITLDLSKIHAKNRRRAEYHGWGQRIVDAAALAKDTDTGKPATPGEKLARMAKVVEHYHAGGEEWNMRATGAPRGPDAGLIITAMCRALTNGDIDKANGLVDKLAASRKVGRDEALREWASTDKVLAAIAAIKAERAPKGADALLAEMEAIEG